MRKFRLSETQIANNKAIQLRIASSKIKAKISALQAEYNKLNAVVVKKHRFGNFEVAISDMKLEIKDVVNGLVRHTYNVGSFEHGLISYLFSTIKATPDGNVLKPDIEVLNDTKKVESLVYMLAYTNLIFSNEAFRNAYYKLILKEIAKQKPAKVDKKEDDAILKEEKTLQEMKDTVKEDVK